MKKTHLSMNFTNLGIKSQIVNRKKKSYSKTLQMDFFYINISSQLHFQDIFNYV